MRRQKKSLRDYLAQAAEVAEKANNDQEAISAIDTNALSTIVHNLRRAMRCLDSDDQPPPDYDGWNSYPLTAEQIKEALNLFADDLLQDDTPDEKAGVLFRSFTYTTDSAARERMMLEAGDALMPYTIAALDTMKGLAVSAHQRMTGQQKGGQG
jgi:hypothetical protein